MGPVRQSVLEVYRGGLPRRSNVMPLTSLRRRLISGKLLRPVALCNRRRKS